MGGEKTKPRYKQYFSIDESVGLHENYSFRLAIFFPVAVSILFIVLFSFQLWSDDLFRFNLTQPEVTEFIKYFTLPISLLSLSIVFGVMVARFHSSKQKAVSNEITLRNNSVNYFYKTHEEFEKYCAKIQESNKNIFRSIRADTCYAVIFSSSTPTNPSLLVDESFFRIISSLYSIYADNFVNYLGSVDSDKKIEVYGRIGPKHNFSGGLSDKLHQLGIETDWFGSVSEFANVEKQLRDFYSSIHELFLFPGLENRDESTEQLNDIHFEWVNFIKAHPKYIEATT